MYEVLVGYRDILYLTGNVRSGLTDDLHPQEFSLQTGGESAWARKKLWRLRLAELVNRQQQQGIYFRAERYFRVSGFLRHIRQRACSEKKQ